MHKHNDRVTAVARNKAQRIIAQTTGCLARSWQYDDLGRVTDTTVSGSGCTVQNGDLLYERMSYFDSSEVKTHPLGQDS